MMRSIKIYQTLILFCVSSLFANINAETLSNVVPQRIIQTVWGQIAGVPDSGRVEGSFRAGGSTLEFRGIPYAKPPVDDLRWAAPVKADGWQEILAAREYGAACPQEVRFDGLTDGSINEDCLSLNVARPADFIPNEKLPVIVWIHGGAFEGGSSLLYRPDALVHSGAANRAIVVTLNYRLGVLGFFAHPLFEASSGDVNGNFGIADQRLAFQWVKENISAFGGDPTNVTLAGEAAGAGSICTHIATPEQTLHFFDKAIIISAACKADLPDVVAMEARGQAVVASMKLGNDCESSDAAKLSCLRRTAVHDLFAAYNEWAKSDASAAILKYTPSVIGASGSVTPRQFSDAVKQGNFVKVPVLMGGTSDELRLYVAYYAVNPAVPDPKDPANYQFWLKKAYSGASIADIQKIMAKYPLQKANVKSGQNPAYLGSVWSNYNELVGINNCGYLQTAALLASKGVIVHEFEFADPAAPVLGIGINRLPDPGMPLGAVHSSDLNYLFPYFSNTSSIDGYYLKPSSQKLAKTMQDYFVNFAHKAKPFAKGAPVWPVYQGNSSVMLLKPGSVKNYNAAAAHQCEFWKSLFKNDPIFK